MLKCRFCEYSHPTMLSPMHIKKHGISTAEYKQLFPNDVLRIQTQSSLEKISNSKKGKSSKLAGVPKTKEHIEKQRASLKASYKSGKIKHWNIGRETPDFVKQKIADGNRNKENAGNIRQRKEKHNRIQEGAISKNCTVLSIDENTGKTTAICNNCSLEFSFTHQVFYEMRLSKTKKLCPACEPRETYSSIGEQELLKFIQTEYAGIIVPNDRTLLGGLEIDVYLPELKLGFEYTGLYWHAEKQNPEHMHLLWKKQFANRLGVRLITIFEDEWINKTEIVKSRIRALLMKTPRKIFARKCKLVIPTPSEKNDFLQRNHIQSTDMSSFWVDLIQIQRHSHLSPYLFS